MSLTENVVDCVDRRRIVKMIVVKRLELRESFGRRKLTTDEVEVNRLRYCQNILLATKPEKV